MHGVIVFLGVIIAMTFGFTVITAAIDIIDGYMKDKDIPEESKDNERKK